MDSECAFHCELHTLDAQPALTIRLKTNAGDMASPFDEGYGAILGYLKSKGKEPSGPPFTIFYNMEKDNLEVEFGFPVEDGLAGEEVIQPSTTPAGKAAGCLHIGPYEEAGPVYDALLQWISENGHEANGVAYEIYLNDPAETPPDQLKTQIYLMLA